MSVFRQCITLLVRISHRPLRWWCNLVSLGRNNSLGLVITQSELAESITAEVFGSDSELHFFKCSKYLHCPSVCLVWIAFLSRYLWPRTVNYLTLRDKLLCANPFVRVYFAICEPCFRSHQLCANSSHLWLMIMILVIFIVIIMIRKSIKTTPVSTRFLMLVSNKSDLSWS